MSELRYPTVFIIAPPFYSHFRPLVALGAALRALGSSVTVGCSLDFQADVESAGLSFREVQINRNANRGIAAETRQADSETRRLNEFLEATKRGPVETLITQGRHRTADMFSNPEQLTEAIRQIDADVSPSLWIVDQLTYGATLAVHGLGLPFITFCAPHPLSIPTGDMVYSVPPSWPEAVRPSDEELQALMEVARKVDRDFTAQFNGLLDRLFGKPSVGSAFAFASPRAVVYNYPPFPGLETEGTHRIFAGHSYQEQVLPSEWRDRISNPGPKILIALGTFLSSRDDVLIRLTDLLTSVHPDASIIIGAGSAAQAMQDRFGDRVIAERFIPQRALLPNVDIVFHHGGVSSFTESLYAAKPMVVMPFSSDQFNVAKDVERLGLGAVLDPNGLNRPELTAAMETAAADQTRNAVGRWSEVLKSRGPAFAAHEIQRGVNHGSD